MNQQKRHFAKNSKKPLKLSNKGNKFTSTGAKINQEQTGRLMSNAVGAEQKSVRRLSASDQPH
jgi:hypothetical protein